MRNFIWEICHNPGIKSKMVVLLYRLKTLHTKHYVIFYPITFCFVILNKIINEVIIGGLKYLIRRESVNVLEFGMLMR